MKLKINIKTIIKRGKMNNKDRIKVEVEVATDIIRNENNQVNHREVVDQKE